MKSAELNACGKRVLTRVSDARGEYPGEGVMKIVEKFAACTAALALTVCCVAPAQAAEAGAPVRVMLIDPLSGPQSATLERASKNLEYAVKRQNDAGGLIGKKIELTLCDSKFNPRDGKNCLDRAIQSDTRFIMQGVGSNVTLTLLDAIEKYNARNPGKEILLVNWAGQEREMTNKYCSYWQFRTDGHTGMKMDALVRTVAADKTIKKVYIVNMDYSTGQDADATAKQFLKQMRPDIEIVGTELHPANRVQDFTPYVSKIQASRADAVITGDLGTDLNRLIRAGNDIGLNVKWFTIYASQYGQVTAIGEKGVNRVFVSTDSLMNMNEPAIDKIIQESEAGGYGQFESVRIYRGWLFLAGAIRRANSDQPLLVARAMENLTVPIGEYRAVMRPVDHQVQLPVYLAVLTTDTKFKQEKTPWGFKVIKTYSAADVSQPTTCQMKRPARA
jgi:branched-chain amino acid transport system substrate-binding protein